MRIRARALVLGLALVWLSAKWIFWAEFSKYTFVTIAVPFAHAIYVLLVLALANLALRRTAPALALNRLELLAIYAMVSVSSALMSTDMLGILVTLIGYPTYFADSTNRWQTVFGEVLPRWLTVTDREALSGFFRGGASFLTHAHVSAWLLPLGAWCLFIWALLVLMLCASVVLRKAWVEHERLTFPIVALPMAIVDDTAPFFTDRLMWTGFAIAAAITMLNGLAYAYPVVPTVPIKRAPYVLIAGEPLERVATLTVSFYFFAIALGFLMPLDLSLSLYLFYLLYRAELLTCAMLGMPAETGAPYADAQAFGAYVALFLASVWRLGPHLRTVWRTALRPRTSDEDRDEPIRYRMALAGLIGSAAFLVAFAVAGGMTPVVAVAYLAIFLAVSVMITRIRAEFGFPVHDLHRMGSSAALVRSFGSQAFDRQTLGMFSLFYWFSRVYRSHPMPHQLEAMRLAGSGREAQRGMFSATLVAGIVAVPVCFLVYLCGFYALGASTANVNVWGTGFGREAFRQSLDTWLNAPARAQWGDQIGTGFGFCVALGLAGLRRAILGFRLHPLAYAVANSWGMQNLWLPIMIGSWCKGGILRARGMQGYRRALGFFFGLMLGEFAVGCSWTVLGMITDVRMYEFWP